MIHGGANTVKANGDDLLLDVWISLKFWNGGKKKRRLRSVTPSEPI